MSDYKRLTKKDGDLIFMVCKNCGYYEEGSTCWENSCDIARKKRLAKLEDKIENGTLIELPCKVGDKLYSIPFDNTKIFEHTVKGFRIIAISENNKSNYIETDIGFLFGKNAFLTKAEAEKILKELKGEK